MEETNKLINYTGKAFISCSLREEDKKFIHGIEKILKRHKIEPFGTVGKYSAAPNNPAQHMKDNIPKADIVIIVATPRYFQRDIKTGEESFGLSEMLHVETGMAFMADKPVIAFVKKGTEIGSFLPKITQYIVLDETNEDLKNKWELITSLLKNAVKIAFEKRNKESAPNLWGNIKGGLAFIGGVFLVDQIFFSSRDE